MTGYVERYSDESWTVEKLLSTLIRSDCLNMIAWSVRPLFLFVGQNSVFLLCSYLCTHLFPFHVYFIIFSEIMIADTVNLLRGTSRGGKHHCNAVNDDDDVCYLIIRLWYNVRSLSDKSAYFGNRSRRNKSSHI